MSSWRWRCIDADAQCKWALNWIVDKDSWENLEFSIKIPIVPIFFIYLWHASAHHCFRSLWLKSVLLIRIFSHYNEICFLHKFFFFKKLNDLRLFNVEVTLCIVLYEKLSFFKRLLNKEMSCYLFETRFNSLCLFILSISFLCLQKEKTIQR